MLSSELYLLVREREGRLYRDEIAARLPYIPGDHPLHDEWVARAASLTRLLGYIRRRSSWNRILELGCGNGWLSHRIAELTGVSAWGMDLSGPELTQAARLFGSANLNFLAGDIFRAPFGEATFDMVLVASAIQYFPDLRGLIRTLQQLLRSGGELHIMDSPLYAQHELASARARTRSHYLALGVPEMAEHYFHHAYPELEEFTPRWHYRPNSLLARLSRGLGNVDSPFPWLSINQTGSHARAC